jgi:hypothetical protein
MKIKKEYLILAVIIVALSLYLIFHDRDRSSYELPQLASIERNEITKIEISRKDQPTIQLNREGSDWKISPKAYPADATRVKELLDVISGLTLTALVSESKNYQIYELDDAHRIHVKAWSKDDLVREFDTGKAASSFRHTFVKLPGNAMVYHARDNFRRKFDVSIDDLRDKKVLAFDKALIHEITIQNGEQTTIFSKQPPVEEKEAQQQAEKSEKPAGETQLVWRNEKNEAADEAGIQRLLTALADLKCDSYLEEKTKEDFDTPIFSIRLKGDKAYSLSLFEKLKEADTQYPAVSSDNPYPFLLPKWRVDNLMKDPAELLKKTEQE